MKIKKQLVSMITVLTLAISLLPTSIFTNVSTVSAEEVAVFTENFESYTVGTIAEGTGKGVIGNIDYELQDGDKIEIAQDGNGNKYLKVTRTATTASRLAVKYKFPNDTTYSNKKFSVSYDIKPDVHNKYFAQFGSLLKDDNGTKSGVNFQTISYKNNVYAYKNSDANYYIGGLLDSSRYTTDSDYATITQTVDFTQASNNYTFTAVYPNGSGGTTTTTKTNTAAGTGFFGLFWSVYKNTTDNNANGLDDASVAAVYRIDNITVNEINEGNGGNETSTGLVSTNVPDNGKIKYNNPFTMTFDSAVSAANVTLKKNGVAMAGGDYTVTTSGSTVSVKPNEGWEKNVEYTVNVVSVTLTSGSACPATSFTLTGTNYLFVEDFEGYEVGTIVNATSDQSTTTRVGNIDYQLRSGDKLEIAADGNGNKYLKITRTGTSASNSHIKYYFPETYANKKYAISYDIKPDVHNRHFARFGSFIRTSGINLTTVSYKDNVYANSSTNTNYYIGGVLASSRYTTDSDYATITQTIDLRKSSDNYEFTAVYPNGSGGISKETKTNTANLLGITGLAWAIQRHATKDYNGTGDNTVAGVYRIDNIIVDEIPFELVSTNAYYGKIFSQESFTMTFSEDVSEPQITLKKSGSTLDSSKYTVTTSGSTVSVKPNEGWKKGTQYTVTVGDVTSTLGGTCPAQTFTFTGSDCLFTEDFESYTVGKIAEGPGSGTIGNIDYELRDGDKIEIAQDGNGNKYLKITRTDTSTNRLAVKYRFPDGTTYSNKKYSVAYDFMPEEHNQYFEQFGSLLKDDNGTKSGVNRKIISYGKNVYFNDSTDSAYYIANLLDAEQYDGSYATVTQTIELDMASPISSITSVLPDDTTTTRTNTVAGTGFFGLFWNIHMYDADGTSGYNGSTDHTNPSVYRIDNIVVRPAKLSLVSQSVVSESTISVGTDIKLKFNLSLPSNVAENINITNVTSEDVLSYGEDYTVSLSEDNKTMTVSPVNGWDSESEYVFELAKIEGNEFEAFEGTEIEFATEAYDETILPNIVSSSIANGADNVDFRTGSVILYTNGALLNEESVTKTNIKLYKNGAPINSYSVSLKNKYAVKVTFDGLEPDKSYTIRVTGLTSRGPQQMTKEYVLNFEAVGDVYADNIALNKTAQSNVFDFTATLHNNTDEAQSYQPIVALKNKSDGKLVGLKLAQSGSLAANSSADILVSGINVNPDNVDCELLLWKNFSALEPVTGKRDIKKINIGKTVIFANNSYVVLVDGEPVEESVGVTKDANGFVIPQALASKYFNINSSLSEDDLTSNGLDFYVSEKYDFIAIGDNISFDAQSEEDTIKDFGIYVSLDGDDSNKGYSSEPVKTLAKAVDLYKNGNKQPIMVHGGTYRLSEALVLNSMEGYDGIVIKDVGDGDVIVSGAVELPSSEFAAVTDNTVLSKIPSGARSSVKQISLASYVDGDMSAYKEYAPQNTSDAYYELFSGDSAQTLARWPNKSDGFATITYAADEATNSFRFSNTEKTNLWKSSGTGIIAGYLKYDYSFEDKYIDPTKGGSGVITLKNDAKYGVKTGQRFYAMNMLEELDEAGEYYIDTENKILYYYPTDSFATVNPELSIMGKTPVKDESDKNCLMYLRNVDNATISGITFEKVRGTGIYTKNGSNISIDGCTLRNIGNTAVELYKTANSEVKNSLVEKIGGPGIVAEAGNNVKLTSGGIVIKDNEIKNFGRIFRTYQAAVNLRGCGNTAQYNTIHHAPHCAVRFTGSKHSIKNNNIYNVATETADVGAIYSGRDWTSWGTTIENNYIWNVNNNLTSSTKQAIYLDDLMSGTIVKGNFIKDCDCAAKIGGGRANTFKDNIVIDCNQGLQYDNRGETTSSGQLVSGGTVYEGFKTFYNSLLSFVNDAANETTMAEAKAARDTFNGDKQGFTNMVADYENNSAQIGYPKHAIITDNSFYGSKVNNSGYLDIANHVTSWGTYSGTTKATSGAPSKPDFTYGKRN